MSFARLIRIIQLGLKSLMLHKLRSGLTMLGIVFGVFSVIAMLAIGEGASAEAQKQIVALGATNIIVRSIKPVEGSSTDQNAGGSPRLRPDPHRLRTADENHLDDHQRHSRARAAARGPVSQEHDELPAGRLHGRLSGSEPAEGDQGAVSDGRRPGHSGQRRRPRARRGAGPVSRSRTRSARRSRSTTSSTRVVGVTAERTASAGIGGSLAAQDFNKDVYIPLTTFRARIGDEIFIPKQRGMDSEYLELSQITLTVRDVNDVLRTADVVRGTIEQFHPQKDFAVVVPLELLKQADQLRQIFNIVLGSIAASPWWSAGIGIMNIMLATVTERTREIGIRRALGAKQRDIIEQFLTETVVLSGTGGLLGVGLGLLTPLTFTAHPLVHAELHSRFRPGALSDTIAHVFGNGTDASPSGACPWRSASRWGSASSSACTRPAPPPGSTRSKRFGTSSVLARRQFAI